LNGLSSPTLCSFRQVGSTWHNRRETAAHGPIIAQRVVGETPSRTCRQGSYIGDLEHDQGPFTSCLISPHRSVAHARTSGIEHEIFMLLPWKLIDPREFLVRDNKEPHLAVDSPPPWPRGNENVSKFDVSAPAAYGWLPCFLVPASLSNGTYPKIEAGVYLSKDKTRYSCSTASLKHRFGWQL